MLPQPPLLLVHHTSTIFALVLLISPAVFVPTGNYCVIGVVVEVAVVEYVLVAVNHWHTEGIHLECPLNFSLEIPE